MKVDFNNMASEFLCVPSTKIRFIIVWSFLFLLSSVAHSEVTLYPAKKIYTMEAAQSQATAIAVENGRILAVGELAELSEQLKSHKPIVDNTFSEKILLPGFIDNHLHPSMAAVLLPMTFITPFDWDLPNKKVKAVQGAKAYFERLSLIENEIEDADEWLITWGFHHYFHGNISRKKLDAISTSRPIIVWHRSFHEIFVNTAGLKALGIEASERSEHPHIDYQQGHFYETGMTVAFAKLAPKLLAPAWFGKGMELVKESIHQGGITTIADMATGMFSLDMEWPYMKAVLDSDTTPFRTALIPMAVSFGKEAGDEQSLKQIDQLFERNSDKLFFVKQIKLLADGAFYSLLMQMQAPGYLDGHHGEWLMEPDLLEAAARRFWEHGYQIHVHSNGDLGTKIVLDIAEKLQQEMPRKDHRFTLHHLGFSREEQSQRMAKLDVLVSANPYYLYTLGDKYSEMGLGPERASNIFRGASLLKNGVPLSLHSDFTMAPSKPLLLASVAVNRRTAAGNLKSPDQRLTVEQAMRAITIEAAYAIRMEDHVGSIKVGKRADFTVLEQDPYVVKTKNLQDIAIWGTVFEGRKFPLAPSK